jgi:hypothetical protein
MSCSSSLRRDVWALQGKWQQPFNLAQGPLLRFKLLQLGPQNHVLVAHLPSCRTAGPKESLTRSLRRFPSAGPWSFGSAISVTPEKTRRRMHDRPYTLARKRTQVLADIAPVLILSTHLSCHTQPKRKLPRIACYGKKVLIPLLQFNCYVSPASALPAIDVDARKRAIENTDGRFLAVVLSKSSPLR